MLNSYIKGIFIFLILIFPLGAVAQGNQSDVEALKRQIDEMQKQNAEMIKKIQEQNAKQIYQLQKQINELEQKKSVPADNTQPVIVVDEESLDKKIESSVNENLLLKTKNWLKLSYSQDFPSYYRTRVRFIDNGTFASATDSKDEVFFIDSRFLLSPKIDVNEYLSVRAQFDIAKNIIWGGLGDQIIADKLYSAPSPGDSFRGAVLRDVVNTQFGNTVDATEDVDLVDVRSLYFFALTDYGAIWAGRQPFDWGLGLLNNAGSMPDQDLGSVVDRINFDTLPLSFLENPMWDNLLFSFIFDRLSEGNSISNFDEGDGWDVGLAVIYDNKDDLQLGAYVFDINQNNFALAEGVTADLDNAIQSSIYGSYILNNTRTSFEFQNIFGKINDISEGLSGLLGTDSIDISAKNISAIARFEYHPPSSLVRSANLEFGWSRGDDSRTPDEIEGNTIFFNNAYAIDSLMYKHIIPTIYALEGSVINSYYFRAWTTMRLTNDLYLTPQAIIGFVDQPNALALNIFEPLPAVDRYLGTELEATFTWKIREHIWFDLIGSLIFAGDGLKDLQAQRALIEGAVDSLDDAGSANHPYAITGRFVITLDSLIDRWYGSSTVLQRAWFTDDNI